MKRQRKIASPERITIELETQTAKDAIDALNRISRSNLSMAQVSALNDLLDVLESEVGTSEYSK